MVGNERPRDKVLNVVNIKKKRLLELITGTHYNMGKKFYDLKNILDERSSQQDVFQSCKVDEMCNLFVNKGKNCNVLVYGPTNSGKTYTMQGDETRGPYSTTPRKSPTREFQRVKSHQRPSSALSK